MIPKDWEKLRISEVCELIVDCVNKTATTVDVETPYRMVRTSNIRDGKLKLDNARYVDRETYDKWTRRAKVIQGDILLTREAPIGEAAIINEETNLFLGQRIMQYRSDRKKLNPRFLYQSFLSDDLQKQFNYHGDIGSTVSHIRVGDCSNFTLLLPPLLEQCRIAEVLGVWDESIDLLERLIGRVRSRKQGLMQQLLTGKKRFKEFGLPIISEDSIPDTWRKVTLRETAAKEKYSFTGGPFGSNLKAEHYIDEGVRIIQLQNIGDGHFNDKYKIFTTEEKADELISCNIYPGDIILSKMGDPVARACFIPDSAPRFLMASDGIRLKVNTSEFDPFFLLQQINSPIFRKIAISHSTGSTRQRIGLDILRDLPILTPPLPEQEKIAAVLSAADEEISTLEKQLAAYKQQKLGLMQQLLTGRIRI
jgi:type I restriction enzyme, S subunit